MARKSLVISSPGVWIQNQLFSTTQTKNDWHLEKILKDILTSVPNSILEEYL